MKNAAKSVELELELTEICRCYSELLLLTSKVEGNGYSIMNAYNDIQKIDFKEDPCAIKEFISRRILEKDFLELVNCARREISPAIYASLQSCTATTCAVERSFSLLKKLLSKDRNFLPENLPKYFVFHYNHCQSEV